VKIRIKPGLHSRCGSPGHRRCTTGVDRSIAASLRATNISPSELERHRDLLNKLTVAIKIDGPQDWYTVYFKHLKAVSGLPELVRTHYASSVARAVATVFHEHNWIPWYFRKLPKDYWSSAKNVSNFVQWLERNSLSVRQLEDWYSVTTLDLRKQRGGSSLLRKYDFSLVKLVRDVFPDHPWDPTKFVGGPGARHWSNPANQRKFMDQVAADLEIKSREEWSRVTVQQIVRRKGGSRLLELHNRSLTQALENIYGPSTMK
jgi:hypothetical protein